MYALPRITFVVYQRIHHTKWPTPKTFSCRLLNVSSATILKLLQCRSKLVKTLSGCQTAWIRMRRRVTRRLIQI